MDETWRGRRNVLHTMNDSELIRRYTLDRTGIMFVTDLIKDMLTSLTLRRNAIAPEMDVITTLTYLATGKMQICSSDDLGLLQHFQNLIVSLFISYKYVKYDSMVNKEFNVCARAREREYGKTGKITLVLFKWRLIINPLLKALLLYLSSWTPTKHSPSKDCVIASNGVTPPPH